MSCSACNCNPCCCNNQQAQEPLASEVNNMILSLLGVIQKVNVNGKWEWLTPCNLGTGLPGFPMIPNEGLICYLLRLFQFLDASLTTCCNDNVVNFAQLDPAFGTLIAGNGSQWVILGPAADGMYLVGDITQPAGMKFVSVPPGSGASASATYITRVDEPGLSNEFALANLATGILKNTTVTGIPTIAMCGTDYYGPGCQAIPITDGGTGGVTRESGFDNLSPINVKGDLIGFNGTHNARQAVGANGSILIADSTQANGLRWGAPSSIPGGGALTNYTLLTEEKATGVDAGTATAGSWFNRVLTTVKADIGNNIISGPNGSGVVTLGAGTYRVWGYTTGYKVANFSTRLHNDTDNTVLVEGASQYSEAANGGNSPSILVGRFTLAAQKAISFQMQVTNNKASNGRGENGGFSSVETYSMLLFQREI